MAAGGRQGVPNSLRRTRTGVVPTKAGAGTAIQPAPAVACRVRRHGRHAGLAPGLDRAEANRRSAGRDTARRRRVRRLTGSRCRLCWFAWQRRYPRKRSGCSANPIELEGANVECGRSEEHTSELQSLMRISYAVFCLKKKTKVNDLNT